MRKTCFFCSEIIVGKITQEHIISNSLLGKLGIKEKTVTGKGKGVYQYSRLKVPTHKYCNNNFGSEYENRILKLLDEPNNLFTDLINEESGIPIRYGPDISTTSLVSTWLSKIYYGLFYKYYLTTNDVEHKETAKYIIDSSNFRMIQNAYKNGVGFCLPSSLYVFQSKRNYFDLKTFIYPQMIMLKINYLVFILVIADGFLTKNYLNNELLSHFRKLLLLEEQSNEKFPLHIYAMAEILALRNSIPKKPSFIYSDNEIINMSLSTQVENPDEHYKVNKDLIAKNRKKFFWTLMLK